MKIAIAGTHGTGKTTLSYHIAAYYKRKGKNVKIIQEVVRSCPFPINEKMTIEAAKWIYLEHSRKELEASKFQVIVGDRSILDSFIYAEYFGFHDEVLDRYRKSALLELDLYDRLIFVRPDMYLHNDGIRSVDKEFQTSIDNIFAKVLEKKETIQITSSKIFDKGEEWMSYCL